MRVLDDADEVPKRVNDGGDLDAAADIGNRLARPGAMMEEPLVGRGDIRYAPVRHGVVAQRRLRSVSECRRVEGPALDGPGAPKSGRPFPASWERSVPAFRYAIVDAAEFRS